MTTTPERTATLTHLVAAEIRAQMGRLDVRQSELARRMGENDQWLSTRLKGRTPIDVNELSRIAKALGLGIHELLPSPEAAAQAICEYHSAPARTIGSSPRPRDNRPSGHPRNPISAGPRRTTYVPRGNGRKAA